MTEQQIIEPEARLLVELGQERGVLYEDELAALAQEIRSRRAGHEVTLSAGQRLRRAYHARRIMRRGVRRLSHLDPAARSAPAS